MEALIRPARADEMAQYGAIAAYVYAGRYGDTPDNLVSRSTHPDWTLCAFVDGRMVTTFATIPFTVRLNGMAAKLGGVSGIGTLPEWRRAGLVRQIMHRAIADMRDRGQSVAALWASQAAIYQRFGFALGAQMVRYTLDPRDIRFAGQRKASGMCRRHSLDEGFPIIRQVYIDFVSARTCYLHRSRALWNNNTLEERAAEGPIHLAVAYDTQQRPQGYMVYTMRFDKVADAARPHEMIIRDLAWLTQDAYLSLWEFVTRHDLVGRVRHDTAPLDDPAPELFEEPRMLYPHITEGIWMRIIDVAQALQARGYTTAGHLVLEIVEDDMAEWNTNVFNLETDGETAQVTRTTDEPDIRLSIKALASLYSGFRTAQTLANWGLLAGSRHGIETANHLFRTLYLPHCPDNF
ncbi:enhanced intracellular survival protein Eis [Thermodesulfobacteriota bacterium]